jgi:hypothetical protein
MVYEKNKAVIALIAGVLVAGAIIASLNASGIAYQTLPNRSNSDDLTESDTGGVTTLTVTETNNELTTLTVTETNNELTTQTVTQTTTDTVTEILTSPPPTLTFGTLRLQLTDAPPKNLTYLYIEIDEVRLNRQGNESGIGPKIIFPIDTKIYNVTALQGLNEIIGENSVPDGNYTMIELHILSANATFADNLDENVTLTVVANGWMKIPVHFRISEGDVTVVILDFDIESTHVSASDVLRPVIKPMVDKQKEPEPEPEPEPEGE